MECLSWCQSPRTSLGSGIQSYSAALYGEASSPHELRWRHLPPRAPHVPLTPVSSVLPITLRLFCLVALVLHLFHLQPIAQPPAVPPDFWNPSDLRHQEAFTGHFITWRFHCSLLSLFSITKG